MKQLEALVTQPQALAIIKEKNPLALKKLLESVDYINSLKDLDADYYLTCAKSGADLLSIIDGNRKVIKSHGQCISCGYHFAVKHL